MNEKIKTTSFWLSVGSSVVLIVDCLSDLFGFSICSQIIEDLVVCVCTILVLFGVVTKKKTSDKLELSKDELIADIENFNNDSNEQK